ncbi:prolipoprotein diacylglyceryl transferase [Candidatus Omnitrophota bacterium]
MHPILLEFGPIKIYGYGLAIALGFMVSAYLVRQKAKQQGLDPEVILNLIFGCVIFGIIGARLLYVWQNLGFYLDDPWQILMLQKGGLSFFGGLVLAIAFALLYISKRRLRVAAVFDLLAPYLALAQAIGRIGCLLNGCCYGKVTSLAFAICFPDQGLLRHPVQIYSCLSLLAIFACLRILQDRVQLKPGSLFFIYCWLYSGLRFLLEFLRADNPLVLANFTLPQLFSIFIFVISSIVLWRYGKLSTAG